MNELVNISSLIYEIRGQKVMLDFDLARMYGVETKQLNQSVKRNKERFPIDFMFQLNQDEFDNLRSQFVTAKLLSKTRTLPHAFTENGVAMLRNATNHAPL